MVKVAEWAANLCQDRVGTLGEDLAWPVAQIIKARLSAYPCQATTNSLGTWDGPALNPGINGLPEKTHLREGGPEEAAPSPPA